MTMNPPGRGAKIDWIKWLQQKLKSPFEQEVCEALDELAKIQDERVFEDIRQLLKHPNPDIRWRAAWALGCLGREEGIPYLEKCLDDEHLGVCFWTARGLGHLDYYRATKALIEGLAHDTWRIRSACAEALGCHERNADFVVDPLIERLDEDQWVQVRQNSAKTLGKIGDPRAIPALIRHLSDRDVGNFASEGLARMGRQAIPGLLKVMRFQGSTDAETVIRAIKTLGKIDAEAGLEGIVAGLAHPHWRARRAAARVLGETRFTREALAALKEAEETETDKHVLQAIRRAIAAHQPPSPEAPETEGQD